jgi:hypothetical protein
MSTDTYSPTRLRSNAGRFFLIAHYVNRSPYNRKRRVDPDCRGVQLSGDHVEEMSESGHYDEWEERTGETRADCRLPGRLR